MNTQGLIIVTLYLIVIVTIIVSFGKKTKNYKDFAIGGATLPWFVVSGTMVATAVGGGTLIGFVGSYYQYGWQWTWMGVGIIIAITSFAFLFATRFRSLNVYTVADVLEKRYDKKTKYVGAVIVFLSEYGLYCAMASSFSTLLSNYIGINPTVALVIGIVIFCFAACVGGFKGVAYTDAIQSVFIIGGALLIAIFVVIKAGGISSYTTFQQSKTFISGGTIPKGKMLGNVISIIGINLTSQSILFQRINATRNEKDAKKASIFTGFIYVLMYIVIIGTIGVGGAIILEPGIGGNDVIVKLLNSAVPQIIAAFYIAVIISAVFTTANSVILSGAMNIARDIYNNINQDATDKQLMYVSRAVIIVGSIVAFFIVKFYPSIIGLLLFTYTTQSCLLVVLYVGMFTKKQTANGGFYSLLIAAVGSLIWQALGSPFGIHAVFIAIAGGFLGFFIGGSTGKQNTPEQIKLIETFRRNPKEKTV